MACALSARRSADAPIAGNRQAPARPFSSFLTISEGEANDLYALGVTQPLGASGGSPGQALPASSSYRPMGPAGSRFLSIVASASALAAQMAAGSSPLSPPRTGGSIIPRPGTTAIPDGRRRVAAVGPQQDAALRQARTSTGGIAHGGEQEPIGTGPAPTTGGGFVCSWVHAVLLPFCDKAPW
jgi:hypothetical protein